MVGDMGRARGWEVECDCGHRDVAEGLALLVTLVQGHASQVHGVHLSDEAVHLMGAPVSDGIDSESGGT
jgi:hypothetical protein